MRIPDALSWLARYESGHTRPVTFLERGVTLPFTTPYLLGGRIRPGERGADLVLANPAGAEGVYILPWGALPDICAPTLHDRALWDRVAKLPELTPRSVRGATRAVALEGHAGRLAARAAAAAQAASQRGRVALPHQMLTELIRQNEAPGTGDAALPLERRARLVLQRLCIGSAPSLAQALAALEQLAEALDPLGLNGNPTGAPLPLLAGAIERMVAEVADWAATEGAPGNGFSRLLHESAGLTLGCYAQAAAALRPALAAIWPLICRWHAAPAPLLDLLARPDWLLDGWALIVALWQEARPEARGLAIRDMAALIPVIPLEVNDWMARDVAMAMDGHLAELRRWRRTVRANLAWLSGPQMALVARNETLRALTA